jgi:peptidoglycan/xylan/chitin deacetylase (PgdA/CDA1 family)
MSEQSDMKTCISIDMDNYEDYRRLIDPEGDPAGPSFYEAIPRFLDFLDAAGARATFFMVARDGVTASHRSAIREITRRGHEVGSHSHTHPYNFSQLSRAQKTWEIARAEETIADILGERPVGFRTPSGAVDSETHEILTERGYLYDSSVMPSPLLWLFMLYGKFFVKLEEYQVGRPANALAPSFPYLPQRHKLQRRADVEKAGPPYLVEIPTSLVPLLGLPFYATLLRRFGVWSFDLLARLHGRGRPLHMAFHLMDLVDSTGTSLGEALARTPGLSVSIDRRERFVSHVFARMASLRQSVTLCELAWDFLIANGLAERPVDLERRGPEVAMGPHGGALR